MRISRYWLRLRRGMPVTFHLSHDYGVLWTGIYGVQIGRWFFGAVQSRDYVQPPVGLAKRAPKEGM